MRLTNLLNNVRHEIKQGTRFFKSGKLYEVVEIGDEKLKAIRVPFDQKYYSFSEKEIRGSLKII